MSEPWDEQARQQRYDELLQQTGAALIGAAPRGWRRIDLIARIVDGVQDFGLTVIMADMSTPEVEPPAQAGQNLLELRKLMYDRQRGAWLSARYVINPPGEFRIFYNHDHDPLWEPSIPPAFFERGLASYPRSTPLGFEEQRDLQRKIADLLVVRAPADRDQIRVMYRAAGNHEEMVGHILGIDGRLREWAPPRELVEFYRQLRAGMYREEPGTWSAASTVVEYPIKISINYLFKEDPRWRQVPSRTAVLDELEMYSRTPDNVADWMKAILPNAERVAEVAGRFRHARVFDYRDHSGRPVANRPPVPEIEVAQVLEYLNTAHVVMSGRGFDNDLFDPSSAADVPAASHTDGAWIWSASVPHYLAKHGVPPEADFVAHIRGNGFTPPQLDQEAKDAAYIALTGEIPAPQAAAPTAPASGELTDRDRRVLAIIERRVCEAGAIPEAYRILDSAEGAMCLEHVDGEWQVADYERGKPRNPQRFKQLWDAGAFLLGSLTVIPSALRAGGSDRNTAKALNDWPVQPRPGEPPLTLLSEKHMAVLMPGREVVRYGQPTGNLTFAVGTEFAAMSLRAEREQQGPRNYRVMRELRTLSGQIVPWHNQPGGGTGYLLPKSVDDHLADGSLTEVTE